MLAAATWMLAVAVASQQSGSTAPVVRLRLVSAKDAVVPGATLTVGLHLRHARGWHTYWKNPGKVGMATRVEWRLPAGWRAGPLLWQLPQRTRMGRYTVWGYEGEALLLCDLRVPKKLTAGAVRLRATVHYLACSDTCRPGSSELSLRLPVRATSKPVAPWGDRFERVRSEQPVRLDELWDVRARKIGDLYSLTLTPRKGANADPGEIYFFGMDRLVSSHAAQRAVRSGRRLRIALRREEHRPLQIARLRGLLHGARGFRADGTVKALLVDVPIRPAGARR